jgi:hypothetical protein
MEHTRVVHLTIVRNPDPNSRLPYLIRVPLGTGLVFRARDTWPRTAAVYCHPVDAAEWPANADVVEEVRVRSCTRRGAAIDLVLDRARENRSQLVFTAARGREVVFWQSPRTRKQSRPNVRLPSARAAGIPELEILVDSHERYPYRFAGQQVRVVRRALPCGDYGLALDGRLVAAVERKSLPDLVSSLTGGKLRYAVADLAALPRAALVVEERYSQVFTLDRVRPSTVADGLAEVQVRWPTVPIVFTDTRTLAEEWTYRFLAAAHAWAATEDEAVARIGPTLGDAAKTAGDPAGAGGAAGSALAGAPDAPGPSTAEVRAWARATGLDVPDKGRLRPEIWAAWHAAR